MRPPDFGARSHMVPMPELSEALVQDLPRGLQGRPGARLVAFYQKVLGPATVVDRRRVRLHPADRRRLADWVQQHTEDPNGLLLFYDLAPPAEEDVAPGWIILLEPTGP